ncbi:MAG: hypothetical protein ACOYCA_01800 [Eggerthellaceae bacterium]|jgi:uncharacterized membrane protein YcjF (UPF0283 family)
MSQRNPLNDRNQEMQQNEHRGSTRRSAASAKPARRAAESVHQVRPRKEMTRRERKAFDRQQYLKDKKEGKTTKKESYKEKEDKNFGKNYYNVPTAEYRKWRRIWIVIVVVAVGFTTASWVTRGMGEALSWTCLVFAYIFIMLAIVLDMFKIRKIRREYREGLVQNKTKEYRADQKKRHAEELERERILAEADESEKKSIMGRLFGRKKK